MIARETTGRPRQLPAHLQGYQVSLPQSLMPYTAPHQDDKVSASAQQLQSLSLQTGSASQDDQLHPALGLPSCSFPETAVNKVSQWDSILRASCQPSLPMVWGRPLSPALSECSQRSYSFTDNPFSEPGSPSSQRSLQLNQSHSHGRSDIMTQSLPATVTSTLQFRAVHRQPLPTSISMLQPTASTSYQPAYRIRCPATSAVNVQHGGPFAPEPVQYQPSYTAPAYPVYEPSHPVLQPTNPLRNATPYYQSAYTPAPVSQPVYQPPSAIQQQSYQPSPALQPAFQPLPSVEQSIYQPVPIMPGPQVYTTLSPQYLMPQSLSSFQTTKQPVPVPELPKLLHDSEREFTDLKMALDHLLTPHTELSEHYKYRVLMERLVLDEAKLIAQSCRHYAQPYTAAMDALQRQYGQPHQLAQSEIAAILNAPDVRSGDTKGFQSFALNIDLLVGMLTSLEGPNGTEIMSTGHVDRLLSKLPKHMRDSFVEHLQTQGRLNTNRINPYNLKDLANWLKVKAEAQRLSAKMAQRYHPEEPHVSRKERHAPASKPRVQSVSVYHGSDKPKADNSYPAETSRYDPKSQNSKKLCLFCKSTEHYLSQCPDIAQRSPDEVRKWLERGKRCRNCGRTSHQPEACTLKKPCSECQEIHLRVLHGAAKSDSRVYLITPRDQAALSNSKQGGKVYLKVVPIIINHGRKSLNTYAILDDGAERTIILPAAVQHLGLKGKTETLMLRTICQDVAHLAGESVSFYVAPRAHPKERYLIKDAYSAGQLALAEQSYPMAALQERYRHLQGLPLTDFREVQPLLLIGADCTHLITAREPVRFGPKGSPTAIHTNLGWALQGPDSMVSTTASCYFTSLTPAPDDLYQHVERLWQLDTLPFRNEKLAVRSRLDQEAIDILETRTERVKVGDTLRYATPLLRVKDAPPLKASYEAVMPILRSTERRLRRDPALAEQYEAEIQKLISGGYVVRLGEGEERASNESWFIPHHLVHRNGKPRLVWDCSFVHNGLSLNEQLLAGPTLGPSLIGVLLRFRQYAVAISGDIRAMFHQVRLLPDDQPILRFVWRNLQREQQPGIYQWCVLPFGTTSSPCCATFALQRHAKDHIEGNEDIFQSIERCFYVDNCLQSLPTPKSAKLLIDKLRQVLTSGGFEIRQWASNVPTVVAHLPSTARSESAEQWLTGKSPDPQEPALGLRWHCPTDQLGFRAKPPESQALTMRHVYKVLARQYDPLGIIIPYTTRAKVLVQRLWAKKRSWDDPNLPQEIIQAWSSWERELPELARVSIPRTYAPWEAASDAAEYTLHVFCDASEQAYGSVAYLATTVNNAVHVSFVIARSRVAPKRQQSMPRLELCAALTGAQLSSLIHRELTIGITETYLWTDSTTVLTWLTSESCRFKVFVGTRVSEIQDLTASHTWRYVDTTNNPADDLTRGLTLAELASPNRWIEGPAFLRSPQNKWPTAPDSVNPAGTSELKQTIFCGLSQTHPPEPLPDISQFNNWADLVKATHHLLHGAAADLSSPSFDPHHTEVHLLKASQTESFPEEVRCLKAGKPVSPGSKLSPLAPEMDPESGLIRVGGRLRHIESGPTDIHPVVLDPRHAVTGLLIRDMDSHLHHPGPDRVFAELRRQYWILRGRQTVKKYQRTCPECAKWRGKPSVPLMADLPPARLRLLKPPFYSTGVDCFGPYVIKVGRRNEKRWGVIFKCLTTRCVHLDLLAGLDADTFLLALRRFIARRGTPAEILSDQGTNFRGAERELREAFAAMAPELQQRLSKNQIKFQFNPPAAPHFGGTWEREIQSVKKALQVVVGTQSLQEDILLTLLIEVEGILNAKPLGYVSSDIADPDPVTPNMLLMGRRDASLPQVSYAPDTLTRRRWRHCQMMVDHYWTQFLRHYLPSLQLRQKWRRPTGDLVQGTVAMIVDPQLPRAQWPIGKVVKVIESADGRVRSAEVRVGEKTYLRPVARLVQLPAIPDDG